MHQQTIDNDIFVALIQHYEHDPGEYVELPRRAVDSSASRIAVAELRNEGYIDEQVRGVVRLTRRGYLVFRNQPNSAA
jgi:hypothetical protein